MKQLVLALLVCASFFSCKQDAKVSSSSAKKSEATAVDAPPKIITQASLDLTKYGIANNSRNVLGGLKVGDLAPDFTALSNRGQNITLSEATEHDRVLLTFFRGDWCGYCTKQLEEFQSNLKELSKINDARVLAITPQQMSGIREMSRKVSLHYSIIPDDDHQIMKDYKVFFHVTDAYNKKIVDSKGKSLDAMNGDSSPVLPVPATYIIGKDMRIKYVFYDPDYSNRPSMDELMAALD